ncbi:hypothetical protein PPE_00634 [Paenibacillus polymyxa E681]|nr:hypothetical protein PPE_00634 [Paenibacillus polymyxa E681]
MKGMIRISHRYLKGMMVLIALILILGGCQKVNKDEDAELISKAKATAVQYLKEKYELDVEITYAKKMPTYVNSEIDIRGHVMGHEKQEFSISVDYNNQKAFGLGINPELKKVLIENGTYPNTQNDIDK